MKYNGLRIGQADRDIGMWYFWQTVGVLASHRAIESDQHLHAVTFGGL
jgi:hypothetical protein